MWCYFAISVSISINMTKTQKKIPKAIKQWAISIKETAFYGCIEFFTWRLDYLIAIIKGRLNFSKTLKYTEFFIYLASKYLLSTYTCYFLFCNSLSFQYNADYHNNYRAFKNLRKMQVYQVQFFDFIRRNLRPWEASHLWSSQSELLAKCIFHYNFLY